MKRRHFLLIPEHYQGSFMRHSLDEGIKSTRLLLNSFRSTWSGPKK